MIYILAFGWCIWEHAPIGAYMALTGLLAIDFTLFG